MFFQQLRFCWTSSQAHLDATVIELSDEAAAELIKLGAKFLRVADAKPGDKVVMVQYPKGRLSLAFNVIESLEDYELRYHIGGDVGSSGSPVLNWECRALGLHRRREMEVDTTAAAKNDPLGATRFASNIRAIADAFFDDRRRLVI